MKADRFNNLRIVEQTTNTLRTEYVVASDTDTWSVTKTDNTWGVTHRGRAYRPVTDTPQGDTVLNFVKLKLMKERIAKRLGYA
jgi:hypothetical protein